MSATQAHPAEAPPKILTPEYYAQMDAAEERLGWYRGMREMLVRMAEAYGPSSRPMHILDAGCGVGGLLTRLDRLAAPGHLVGLDLASEALRYCRQRSSFALVESSVVPLPFASSSFDVITCADVLQHIDEGDDQRTLEEFFRVLRPGGVLVLRVARGWGDPTYSHRYYELDGLAGQFRGAGFSVEKATFVNRISYWFQSARRRVDSGFRGEGLPQLPPSGAAAVFSPAWWKDKLIYRFLRQEAEALAGTPRTFSRGNAVLVVGRKRAASDS